MSNDIKEAIHIDPNGPCTEFNQDEDDPHVCVGCGWLDVEHEDWSDDEDES